MKRKKKEFSKVLLYVDYGILFLLVICVFALKDFYDFSPVLIAWIAQLGLSQTAYYWKAKSENRIKVPIKVISSLPKELVDDIDLTQVITSIIQSD